MWTQNLTLTNDAAIVTLQEQLWETCDQTSQMLLAGYSLAKPSLAKSSLVELSLAELSLAKPNCDQLTEYD